eukprot:gene2846-3107_t
MIRSDLRGNNQYRNVCVSIGDVAEADGAAMVQIGQSTVRAAVTGPSQPRFNRHENNERCTLEIELSFLSGVEEESRIYALRQRLHRALTQCLILEAHPRLLIFVQITVVSDQGNIYATAFNAAMLALLDAALPMRRTGCAMGAAIVGGSLLVDPSADEERLADALIEATIETESRKLLGWESNGLINSVMVAEAQQLLASTAAAVAEVLQQAIRQKIALTLS